MQNIEHLKTVDAKLLVVDVIIIIMIFIITNLDFFLFRNFILFPLRMQILYSTKLTVWLFPLISSPKILPKVFAYFIY